MSQKDIMFLQRVNSHILVTLKSPETFFLQLFDLKEVSNCLNDVMLEVSGTMKPDQTTDVNKLNRILERQLNQCTTLVKRQLKQCKVWLLLLFF